MTALSVLYQAWENFPALVEKPGDGLLKTCDQISSVSLVSLGPEDRGTELMEKVLGVAEEYGLDVEDELDEVGVKYLGTYVNAQTSKQGSVLRIDFDSRNFFEMSRERQRRTILHELIHVKQFNDSLSDWAEEEFDVSEEFAEKLDGTIWEGVKSVEGETELILSSFFPEEESSYPYAQSRKESELDSLGIDIDSEIGEEIEEEAEDILEEYREIEEFEAEENIYLEEGSIGGIEYSVAYLGEDAPEKGPEKVKEYLENEIEDALEYGEEPELDYSGIDSIGYKPACC